MTDVIPIDKKRKVENKNNDAKALSVLRNNSPVKNLIESPIQKPFKRVA